MAKKKHQKSSDLAALGARFAELWREEKKLRTKLKKVNEEEEQVAERMLNRFQATGVTSITAGGVTAYLHRSVFAGLAKDKKPQALKALKRAGLTWMVNETCSRNTLSAWVREQDEDKNGMPILPPKLKRFIEVVEKFSVRGRKK